MNDSKPAPLSNLSKTLGLEELPENERDELLEEIGGVVLESTLTRFVGELEEKDLPAFEATLEKGTDEEAMTQVFEAYPRLVELFNEEIAAMHAEAEAVLGAA